MGCTAIVGMDSSSDAKNVCTAISKERIEKDLLSIFINYKEAVKTSEACYSTVEASYSTVEVSEASYSTIEASKECNSTVESSKASYPIVDTSRPATLQ